MWMLAFSHNLLNLISSKGITQPLLNKIATVRRMDMPRKRLSAHIKYYITYYDVSNVQRH